MILQAVSIKKEFARSAESAKIFCAVNETDLTLEPGKLIAVMGKSGSGKSTLLNMLCGLLKPTAGSVLLDDKNLYDLDDEALSATRNKNFGVIPQGQSTLRSLTVMENILLPAQIYGSEVDLSRAENLLSRAGIEHLQEEKPNELSGGELRRMAVVRALVMKPAFVFADEPTNDLDYENTATVLKLLRETADDGVGVLLVSHDSEAASYADKVFDMRAGTLSN